MQRHGQTGRMCAVMQNSPSSPINRVFQTDDQATYLDLSYGHVTSSLVPAVVTEPVQANRLQPIRTVEESLHMLANTCSDLVDNMSMTHGRC